MSTFNMDYLKRMIKDFADSQPQFNNEAIDKMIEQGNNISELVMIHSMPELQDEKKIKTKHGYIELLYTSSKNIEYGTSYIMKKPPKNLMELFPIKYEFNIKESEKE